MIGSLLIGLAALGLAASTSRWASVWADTLARVARPAQQRRLRREESSHQIR